MHDSRIPYVIQLRNNLLTKAGYRIRSFYRAFMDLDMTSWSKLNWPMNAANNKPSWLTIIFVDCEQSLFSSETVGKTQNKRGSVTGIVTALPLVASAHGTSAGSRHHRSHVTPLTVTLARLLVLRFSPRIFEEKRNCSQSIIFKVLYCKKKIDVLTSIWGQCCTEKPRHQYTWSRWVTKICKRIIDNRRHIC